MCRRVCASYRVLNHGSKVVDYIGMVLGMVKGMTFGVLFV